MNQDQNPHLLAELELNLVQAGPWKRLANYLIDTIVFYVILIVFFIFYGMFNPEKVDELDSPNSQLLINLLSIVFYVVVYCLIEGLSKGRTFGKMITGTRAVYQDGSPISMYTAFTRSLSRIVPFEFLSAFGNPSFPWHDRWTDTYVIDVKNSSIPL